MRIRDKKKMRRVIYLTYQTELVPVVEVVNTIREKMLNEMDNIDLQIIKINKFDNYFNDLLTIREDIKKADIVLIMVDGSGVLEKYSIVKLFNRNIKVIWEVHGPIEVFKDSGWLAYYGVMYWKLFKRKFWARMVDVCLCPTECLRNYCVNNLGLSNIHIVPNSIDMSLLDMIAKKNSLINFFRNDLFVVFWGGGANFKCHRLDIIEDVAKKVYKIDKQILFVIMGNNSWHKFKEVSNILKLESYPHHLYLELMKRADVCLALYDVNNFYYFPVKILEYMSFGKPVIATNVGQIGDLIKQNNGWLVDNKVDEIANIIIKAHENVLLTQKMGENGRLLVENYSLENVSKKVEKIFLNL